MEDQVPMDDAVEVVIDSQEEAYDDDRSVMGEFRSLGEHLVAAMRAAATTPEAEALKTDVQEGMRNLRDEIDSGLGSARSTASERRASGKSGDQLRNELAGALRSVNGVLERFAASMDNPSDVDEPEADEASASTDE